MIRNRATGYGSAVERKHCISHGERSVIEDRATVIAIPLDQLQVFDQHVDTRRDLEDPALELGVDTRVVTQLLLRQSCRRTIDDQRIGVKPYNVD